jgi:glycogen synthase
MSMARAEAASRQVAFVSREIGLDPGGEVAAYVAAAAAALADKVSVTVVTTSAHAQEFALPPAVRLALVEAPASDSLGAFHSVPHAWSARVCDKLRELYPSGGPNVAEFPDLRGEACVTVQAKRTRDPTFRNTIVCVRLYGSAEMRSVLNGFVGEEFPEQIEFELERYSLRFADRLLAPTPEAFATYQRFYGRDALAPAEFVGHPPVALMPLGARTSALAQTGTGLRFLYIGPLERRKGVQNLLRAATALEGDDWSLTVAGADTNTGPLGVSMRDQLELMAADDPRIEFVEQIPQGELAWTLDEHDIVVLPSLWECWSREAVAALSHGVPVLATPTAAFLKVVQEGRSGWLTADTSASSLAAGMNRLLDRGECVAALAASGAPRGYLAELASEDDFLGDYTALGSEPVRTGSRLRSPLVSVIVPYFELDEFLEDTLASARAQSYDPIELIIINDGSLRSDDTVVWALAQRYDAVVLTQPNSGLGAARNFGITQSRGEYVFPLDADNLAEPDFVSRCVDVLEADRNVAFVSSWLRYVDGQGRSLEVPEAGAQPLGNWPQLVRRNSVAADAAAVFPRWVFAQGFSYSPDLTSYEDWLLYMDLHVAGLYGHVIPECLIGYRVREESMAREFGDPYLARLYGEIVAHNREQSIQWTG